ncbi:MAG: GDSL-type esterase/lipase family protein [Planctomycetota bacterium]|jgi:beta-glucosidase
MLPLHLLSAGLFLLPMPAPQESGPPPPAKVLQIGIDGLRPDCLQAASTPHLDLLAQRGALTLVARTTPITSSGPAWTTILTGARTQLHEVIDNSFDGRDSDANATPTWLERLETQRPGAYTAAISQWAPIHEFLTSGHVDFSMGTDDARTVTQAAVDKLTDQTIDLTAMFLHYDNVDHAGHEFGYGPDIPEYLRAIEAVDHEIGKVLVALQSRKTLLFEDWLILVGTDHGGIGTGHGEDVPECRTVFLLASGSSTEGHAWRETPDTVDFATLALRHLGLRSTTTPEPRTDGWWTWRADELNRRAAEGTARIAFFGDSITQGWEGAGKEVWQENYAPLQAVNLGIGGDRTEHVLWRMRHGNLKNMEPEVCVVMIGTNNTGSDSSSEIAKGVQAVVAELLFTLPETQVLLLAIFPRGADAKDGLRVINEGANAIVKDWAGDQDQVHYLDINAPMLDHDGVLPKEIMPDLLHPNEEGYRIWAEAMAPKLEELLESN